MSVSRYVVVTCCLLAGVSAGCGKSDQLERAVLTGKVTWKGQPLEAGRIRFIPKPGSDVPQNGGEIIAGEYKVNSQGGAATGEYMVEITAFKIIKVGPTAEDPEIYDVPEQYLPAKYNKQSTLSLTVPAGGESVTQNFDLTE